MIKKLAFVFLAVHALENSIIVKLDSNPNSLYGYGASSLYPSARPPISSTPLSMGQSLLVYLRFRKTDDVVRTYTSVFYPAVDDYSQLVVPNSWNFLSTFASGATFTNSRFTAAR
jgi:hypothetical protein